MPVPWLRVLNGVLGLTDVVRQIKGHGKDDDQEQLTVGGRGLGAIEARLAGVVVAALKEAFDRDHQRLELERQQMDTERLRLERGLRLELLRQAGDREIGRLRLLAGVAVVSWLGTLFFAMRLIGGAPSARVLLGIGWLLLLGALGAAFSAQTTIGRALSRVDEHVNPAAALSSSAGAIAPWLLVAGLAAIALGVLLA
jgi:hypothetical protein